MSNRGHRPRLRHGSSRAQSGPDDTFNVADAATSAFSWEKPMKRILWGSLVAAAAVCAVFNGPQARAQGAGRPAQTAKPAQGAAAPAAPRLWYSVNVVTVKRETAAEWREFQKSQSIPLQQRGGMKMRDTWASGAPFGDGSTFVVVTEIEKFADYDQPPLPQRLLSGEALRTYQATNQRLVASNRNYAVQSRPELSIAPAANATIMGAVLTETTVVSGHTDQFEAYLKNDLLPVLKKGNALGYLVARTVFGGNANEYHSLQFFDSYADIDKGPLPVRVLGQAGAQALTAKVTAHVASVNRTLLRYVPDLSFRPRPTS
jgi:hypothetical protein